MRYLVPNKNQRGIYFESKQILKFPIQNDYISDSDIHDLFMGLINLVKKTTELKIEDKYIAEIQSLKKEINYLKSKKSI